MDSDGSGEIGWDEFTLLSEERWSGGAIDPYKKYQDGLANHEHYVKTQASEHRYGAGEDEERNEVRKMGKKVNDTVGHMHLESLSKDHLKIPITKKTQDINYDNINRSDPSSYLAQSLEIPTHGRPSEAKDKISNVMRHDYLRKSMVDRIERKSHLVKNQRIVTKDSRERSLRLNRA